MCTHAACFIIAVLWLEEYLTRWPKTLLIVSHAREFLNAVCTDILHLHSRKLMAYKVAGLIWPVCECAVSCGHRMLRWSPYQSRRLLLMSCMAAVVSPAASHVVTWISISSMCLLQGDYNTFERTMAERQRNAKKAADSQDMKRKHIQAFIDRFRYASVCPIVAALGGDSAAVLL
jgi:ATPase subunit of ABC transporter with duplicated ATPase domains